MGKFRTTVAEAYRFQEAPEGYRPNDILKDARSVVVLAIPLLKGVLRKAPSREYFLNYFMVNHELNSIALQLGCFLESEGFEAVPVPASYPYNVDENKGDLSHRHAAVLAGIGVLGKNNLLITKNYGPRVRLVSIVTNAPLKGDEPLNQNFCQGCEACIKSCPVNALISGYIDKEKCVRQLRKNGKELKINELICGVCIRVCPVGKED
ncbi:MAG: 4Fe-4S binding protein [Candidatus Jordarchaeum sp.]|uniref:4Fe-4S binding protein n=1 Tax=Candidatus Jordarchaeum sp. TaxID=2823881 RepID=UPI0040498A77